MRNDDILQSLQRYKQKSSKKYGILKLGIFGSVARGTMNKYSDLDIIVALQKQDLFNLIGIKQDLEDYFQVKVDVVSYRPQMDSFLKQRIDKEAVYV
ncbi:MAG: nucleotidyltransferase domain-containing protein [Desulfobacterales bacterium]|nr:nucleotidyltransferase domain-containing protein [Desulfobacterales bacterium]